MANVKAVHFVGESIMDFLEFSYPEDMRTTFKCAFKQTSTGALAAADDENTTLTLLLYRVQMNEHQRQARGSGFNQRKSPLALDLHYLLTAWSSKPSDEHVTLTWAMRQLQLFPVLDKSMLRGTASWKDTDRIEIIPAELSHEQMARIWDKLRPTYRLSVGYVARMVLIEEDETPDALPVIAERFSYEAKG